MERGHTELARTAANGICTYSAGLKNLAPAKGYGVLPKNLPGIRTYSF